jgi:hypothetical protein
MYNCAPVFIDTVPAVSDNRRLKRAEKNVKIKQINC